MTYFLVPSRVYFHARARRAIMRSIKFHRILEREADARRYKRIERCVTQVLPVPGLKFRQPCLKLFVLIHWFAADCLRLRWVAGASSEVNRQFRLSYVEEACFDGKTEMGGLTRVVFLGNARYQVAKTKADAGSYAAKVYGGASA